MKDEILYTAGEIAKIAGVSLRTIRFYDVKGLLKPVSYSDAGYRYYNQESLWGEVAEYQKNVLTDIQHNIPADVKNILDVGCGDGFVINSLAGKYECTGVDISETALKSVQCRKMVASATDLPFEDDSFDLVMISLCRGSRCAAPAGI